MRKNTLYQKFLVREQSLGNLIGKTSCSSIKWLACLRIPQRWKLNCVAAGVELAWRDPICQHFSFHCNNFTKGLRYRAYWTSTKKESQTKTFESKFKWEENGTKTETIIEGWNVISHWTGIYLDRCIYHAASEASLHQRGTGSLRQRESYGMR